MFGAPHRLMVVMTVLSFGAISCGQLLDVDGYQARARPESEEQGTIYTPACRSCLDEVCVDQLDACAADQACSALLSCIEACSDPGCVSRCSAPSYGPLKTWPIEEVEDCLIAQCRDHCPIGETFDCQDYSWAATYERDEVVALEIKVFELGLGLTSAVDGVEVTPCIANEFVEECDEGRSSETDEEGFATVSVAVTGEGYNGHFRGRDPEEPTITYRSYRSFPFNDYWDLNQFGVDRLGLGRGIYEGQTGKTFGEGVGALWLEVQDCNTWPANGVVLAKPVPSDDIWVYYPSGRDATVGEGIRDDDGDLVQARNFIAIVAPPGELDLELRTLDGELVRHLRLPVKVGHFDSHIVYPQQP
jgi:hypothetical protein